MKPAPSDRRASARYHHGDLRRALIDRGLQLLERDDGHELNLRELAGLVGVSPAAVYRHFADKEALLVALAVEGLSDLTAAQVDAYRDAAVRGQSPVEAFCAGGLAYVRFARAHPALFRLMFGRFAAAHRSDVLDAASRENGAALMSGVEQMLGWRENDAALRATAIGAWSLVHGLSLLILDGNIDGSDEEIERLAATVIGRASDWAAFQGTGPR